MEEKILWKSSPSQLTNFHIYLLLFWTIVIPLYVYLSTRLTIYEMSTNRLKLKSGILNQKIEEVELYRIRDYFVDKPFYLRIFNLGNLVLKTSDISTPIVKLHAIKNVEEIGNLFRNNVEKIRKATGTREMDIS